MLTDNDLTTELRGAFRDATGDLRYAGRVPTPRHRLVVAAPLAATAAAAATLAVVWAGASEGPPAEPAAREGVSLVTENIEVAGFSLSYQHAPGDERENDLYFYIGDEELPADAEPMDAPDGKQAWSGTLSSTGDHGIWIRTTTRPDLATDGAPPAKVTATYAILSPTWSIEELRDLVFKDSGHE